MYFCCMFTVVFLAGVIETGLGNCGFIVQLVPLVGFYLFVVSGWRHPLLPLLVMCGILDAMYMRCLPVECLTLISLAFLAEGWRSWGDMSSWLALCLVGWSIGFVSCGMISLESYFSADKAVAGDVRRLVFWWLSSGPCLYIVCNALNKLAIILDVRQLMIASAMHLYDKESSHEE